MTETPAPAELPPAELTTLGAEAVVLAIVVGVASAVTVGFVTLLLLRAAEKPPGSMVTLSLSILTLASIGVYAATGADVMAAIVGTGIGALAGAVTYQLAGHRAPGDDPAP